MFTCEARSATNIRSTYLASNMDLALYTASQSGALRLNFIWIKFMVFRRFGKRIWIQVIYEQITVQRAYLLFFRCARETFNIIHFKLAERSTVFSEYIMKPKIRLPTPGHGSIPGINRIRFTTYKTPVDGADIFIFQHGHN